MSLEGCPQTVALLNCDTMPKFKPIILPQSAKLKIKRGIFLERVSRLIDSNYYPDIHKDPTSYLPQDLYDEIQNMPICPKCGKKRLLIHTIELKNKYGRKIPAKTCCS